MSNEYDGLKVLHQRYLRCRARVDQLREAAKYAESEGARCELEATLDWAWKDVHAAAETYIEAGGDRRKVGALF